MKLLSYVQTKTTTILHSPQWNVLERISFPPNKSYTHFFIYHLFNQQSLPANILLPILDTIHWEIIPCLRSSTCKHNLNILGELFPIKDEIMVNLKSQMSKPSKILPNYFKTFPSRILPKYFRKSQTRSLALVVHSFIFLMKKEKGITLLHSTMQNCKRSFPDDKLTGTFAKTRFAWRIDVKKGSIWQCCLLVALVLLSCTWIH